MSTLVAVAARCHEIARQKGWHDKHRQFGTLMALVHSEISEALECVREHSDIKKVWYEETPTGPKPCGVASELADAVIRIFDISGLYGIDIDAAIKEKMEYNLGRAHRHGGKQF